MLVSIIVPFYNVEPYFRRCLDSIVNQTYRNIEIVLVNDCSPDNSIAIAREYAAKDERVVIIEHEKNLGLGGARNSGLAAARGEYVWFIDSDDQITAPYALSYLLDQMHKYSPRPDIVMFKTAFSGTDKNVSYHYSEEVKHYTQEQFKDRYEQRVLHVEQYDQSIDFSSCNKLFKRGFLIKYDFKFLEKTIQEDYIIPLYLPLATSILEVPLALYNYLYRENSITSGKRPNDYLDHLDRMASQLSAFYHKHLSSELPRYFLESLIILLYPPSYIRAHIRNIKVSPSEAYLKIYNDLKKALGDKIAFIELNPIPNKIMGVKIPNKEAWIKILNSFSKKLNDQQKIALSKNLIKDQNKSNLFKKMIKGLLPYGLIRIIQVRKYGK